MKALLRLLLLVFLAGVSLQLFFAGRIALMAFVDPESTAFERSAAYAVATGGDSFKWRQQWLPYRDMSDQLKRAVIAAEDASFIDHDGLDIDALEKAWDKNAKAEKKSTQEKTRKPRAADPALGQAARLAKAPKIIGGSTITQQLAKNLFLSGERTLLRKGQELVITVLLERLLNKERILEIYLNSVEWGEGVFGAEAASQRYYGKSAARLNPLEAARLAVMLPRPKYFETRFSSGYLTSRANTIAARMSAVELP